MPDEHRAADGRVLARVTDQPIDRATAEAFAATDADGAVVTFAGVVRDHDGGRSVSALDYEAHPDAERFLREVCVEAAVRTGLRIAAVHRVGALRIGDVALLAVVAAPHRAEAFAAISDLVDRIKERVPIWKRQHLDDGVTEWVGL